MLTPAGTEWLGIAVFVGLSAAFGFWILSLFRRSTFTLPQTFLLGLNYVLSRLLWRATIRGHLELDPGKGAIIVSNHRSPVDPSFLYLATQRIVHWMVAREYCVHPAMAWFFRISESIPVGRGGVDTAATRLAIRYAQKGDLVGMFPEGRINRSADVLMPGRSGAALIALRARVPIVPMYIEGTPFNGSIFRSVLMPARVRLTIGSPIDLSDYYDRADDRAVHREVTERLLREIAALAGHTDFEPRLAGRSHKEPVSR